MSVSWSNRKYSSDPKFVVPEADFDVDNDVAVMTNIDYQHFGRVSKGVVCYCNYGDIVDLMACEIVAFALVTIQGC